MEDYKKITFKELREQCKEFDWYNKKLSKLDLYRKLHPDLSVMVCNEKYLRDQTTKDLRSHLEKKWNWA